MTLTDDINGAFAAAETARIRREDMRWKQKRGDPDRERLIAETLAALADAMDPIRRAIGGIPFGRVHANQENRLREASKALQHERKRFKKLRGPDWYKR